MKRSFHHLNIKIEQIHNYKIQYLLIKEKIEKIQNQKNINLDTKNKLIQEIILKLNKILKKTNDYLEEQNQDNNINDNVIDYNIEENLKKLKIFIDKYKKLNNRLQEINNKSYISSLNNKMNEIDKEINLYEKEKETKKERQESCEQEKRNNKQKSLKKKKLVEINRSGKIKVMN